VDWLHVCRCLKRLLKLSPNKTLQHCYRSNRRWSAQLGEFARPIESFQLAVVPLSEQYIYSDRPSPQVSCHGPMTWIPGIAPV